MTSTLFAGGRKLDANGRIDDFWMVVDGDTIVRTGTGTPPPVDDTVELDGAWLVPGFIDLHGHGAGGHAFDDGVDDLRAALGVHREHGTTRSVLSLVANPLADLERSLALIAELAASDPLVLGAHLEGPFLAPARRGAHNADFLLPPTTDVAAALIEAGRGALRQVTIAPELPGALDVVALLVEAGVTVAVGHTEADYAQTRAAFDRGARLLTHGFNGMPGIHHRAPGPIIAAFDDDRVTIELVFDGKHVDPSVAAMTFRSAPGRVALVTDAMAAAGFGDGDYQLGSLAVAVRGGIAMLRGTTTIAGSTLTQDVALRHAVAAGVDPVDAIAALTITPAGALGLGERHGVLAEGYAADAVVLDGEWRVRQVWADGRRLP